MNEVNSIKNYSISPTALVSRPVFFDLKDDIQQADLIRLLQTGNPKIIDHDQILSQLRELVKCRNPLKKKITEDEYATEIEKLLSGKELDHYGIWVYYPWSQNLVHILSEDEFIELRTSRNKYKITKAEQDILSTQKIGIIGLSVGQSIALTMAMERTFGEIRLADFDTIELTNLNRIRTGVQSIGLPKTVVAAREIAEIDPFLKTVCYHDGITEENIDDFFMKGGKLDILVEECDGIDVKILARIKAKELGVAVVMDTSDRGMIDVERFDLEPNRPLLHGLIGNVDPKLLKTLTNEEKIPFLLPIVGVDTMSSRLRASAIEVGQSLTTWPQLATSVILGGALAGDTCRRISLGQFTSSGRYFIDLEEMIAEIPYVDQPSESRSKEADIQPLETHEMVGMAEKLALSIIPGQTELSKDELNSLMQAARLAPSGGNSQPWRWLYKDDFLHLFFDKSCSTSFLDFDDTSSLISLGSAIENVVLKAHELGFEVNISHSELNIQQKIIATFSFFKDNPKNLKVESHKFDSLVHQIEKRTTNRKNPGPTSMEDSVLEQFVSMVTPFEGANLQWITDPEVMARVGDIMASCDRIRLLHAQSHMDFITKEMRWNEAESLAKMDGIDVNSLELTPLQLASIQIIKDPKAIKLLHEWKLGYSFTEISKQNIRSASAIGFLSVKGYDPKNYIAGGRLVEKLWLMATEKEIALHPMCVPLTFFSRLLHGNPADFGETLQKDLEIQREKFASIFETEINVSEIFLFRIFKAHEPEMKTVRQPIHNILHIG